MAYKKPECTFKKSPQGLDEAKSKGQVNLSIKKNLIETLRSRIDEHNLIDNVIEGVAQEVKDGKYKNAIKLIDIAKEPEDKNINLKGGVEIQKVFIDEATKEETKKHIQDFIND